MPDTEIEQAGFPEIESKDKIHVKILAEIKEDLWEADAKIGWDVQQLTSQYHRIFEESVKQKSEAIAKQLQKRNLEETETLQKAEWNHANKQPYKRGNKLHVGSLRKTDMISHSWQIKLDWWPNCKR